MLWHIDLFQFISFMFFFPFAPSREILKTNLQKERMIAAKEAVVHV
jgi:hypothetical protein